MLETISPEREEEARRFLRACIALQALVPKFSVSVGMLFAKPSSDVYFKSVSDEWELIKRVVAGEEVDMGGAFITLPEQRDTEKARRSKQTEIPKS